MPGYMWAESLWLMIRARVQVSWELRAYDKGQGTGELRATTYCPLWIRLSNSVLRTTPSCLLFQVEGKRFLPTCRLLWQEEGLALFAKGLSARLVLSISFSFFIILGYETLKRWSIKEEYKDKIRWWWLCWLCEAVIVWGVWLWCLSLILNDKWVEYGAAI